MSKKRLGPLAEKKGAPAGVSAIAHPACKTRLLQDDGAVPAHAVERRPHESIARSLRKQIRNDQQVSHHMLRLALMSLDGALFFMTSPPLDIHPLQCLLCGGKRSPPATSMKAEVERDLFPNRVKIS
jgi:hypothetical protein